MIPRTLCDVRKQVNDAIGRHAAGIVERRLKGMLPPRLEDREPCPKCGARGDYDCGHSRVRFGTSFSNAA
jgi:hypothetical protein